VKAKLVHVKDIRPCIHHDRRQMSNLLFLLAIFCNFLQNPLYHISAQCRPGVTTNTSLCLWDRRSKRWHTWPLGLMSPLVGVILDGSSVLLIVHFNFHILDSVRVLKPLCIVGSVYLSCRSLQISHSVIQPLSQGPTSDRE
jgi:hypothetical protein